MHEHGLADNILETVQRRPDRPPGTQPVAITVLVAELGGLSEDALQDGLDHVCEHHGLPRIALELTTADWLGECPACGEVGVVSETLVCPACNAAGVRLCGAETVLITACRYA